ncbi:MAG TPA: hypothetical protein VF761_03690 [Gemmatimonadaceae bacterium]
MEKSANEKYCPECGAVIPKNAAVCPICAARQPGAGKSTTTKVLIGCGIAAAVFVLAIPAIGIIAAIAIPKFANTKQKAYVAAMKADLRNLVTAEEAFRSDSGRYTSNVASLDFHPMPGVSAPALTASKDRWTATITHSQLPGQTCGIAVNADNPVDPNIGEGEPACTSGGARGP